LNEDRWDDVDDDHLAHRWDDDAEQAAPIPAVDDRRLDLLAGRRSGARRETTPAVPFHRGDDRRAIAVGLATSRTLVGRRGSAIDPASCGSWRAKDRGDAAAGSGEHQRAHRPLVGGAGSAALPE
jgi:hypothetical protein